MRAVFFILLFIFVGCMQSSNNIMLQKKDFSISYPSHLELDESAVEETIFILKTNLKDEDDIFVENINLVTKPSDDVEFVDFVEATQREIKGFAEVLESKVLHSKGKDYLRIIFKLKQNNLNLIFIQHYFIANNKIYVLTFSSESEAFNEYFKEMNDVLMSFTLK